jgi:Putative MetA-pathway of phenol degradation
VTGARPPRSALVLRKTVGKPSRTGAGASGKARISGFAKYALTRAIFVPIGFGMAWISAPPPAMADPSGGDAKQELTGSQTTPDESDSTNNGSDLTRPQNSFETRLRDQTSTSPTSRTNRDSLFLQLNSKVTFDDGWKLAMLARVPVVTESTVTFVPSGSDQVFGLGNAVFQTILAHAINERWAFGIGARLVARAASDDLGNGKWQIMPGFGVRYLIPEWGPDSYFVPAVRYAMSFAGDPSARRISEPQIAPTLNIDLPGPWFLTFYPSYDIRINFGAPKAGQTGRLFLPFDALAGVKLTDNLEISLEVGVPIVKEYPVYNFKTEARVRVSF